MAGASAGSLLESPGAPEPRTIASRKGLREVAKVGACEAGVGRDPRSRARGAGWQVGHQRYSS